MPQALDVTMVGVAEGVRRGKQVASLCRDGRLGCTHESYADSA
jgi:hypothetical protein